MKSLWCASILAAVAMNAASAQPVYRCGADGRTYSQTPCPEGRVIDATDSRSDAQRDEALRRTAAEVRQNAEMARERRLREASIARSAEKPAAGASKARKGKGKIRTIQVKSKPGAATGSGLDVKR